MGVYRHTRKSDSVSVALAGALGMDRVQFKMAHIVCDLEGPITYMISGELTPEQFARFQRLLSQPGMVD